MSCHLLLTDPHDPAAPVRVVPLELQLLQTSPGGRSIAVTFQPNRADDLHTCARDAAELAYRILFREGVVRSQLVVRFRMPGAPVNVVGRSATLPFALAILLKAYEQAGQGRAFPSVAATGALDPDGTVRAVEHLPAKLSAAVSEFSATSAMVFFPASDGVDVAAVQASPSVDLVPIGHLDEALERVGIVLERVYLRNPYRGLEAFEYQHQAIFFGRERETIELLQQLLRREKAGVPGVLVEGPSGSGKSSFLRASVLPALVNPRDQPPGIRGALALRPVSPEVRHAIWRPGLMPDRVDERLIVRSIGECWSAFPEMAGALRTSELGTLWQLAQRWREHWPQAGRFVWLIDQLEQIFNLALQDGVLDALGGFLRELQVNGGWTLASIRSDALPQLKCHEALRRVFGVNEGQHYLGSVRGLALDDVINLPARAADLTFGLAPDGRALDQLLREEAHREPDSLPLLQFTLSELYLRRSGGELTYAEYQRLGGLAGSVATTAEAILKAQANESPQTAPHLFRSLVSVDDTGRALRRYAPIAEINQDAGQKRLLSRLVEARLCVTEQREGEPVVAFAHDSLLLTLPVLTDWLKEEGSLLQTRELAERETRLWLEHGRSNAWLAAADKAVSFKGLERAGIALSADVRTFVDRSDRQAIRTTRIKRAAVAAIASLAVAASIGAWVASRNEREAEYQTAQARRSQLRALTQVAAERLKGGDLALARGIILEALRRTPASALPEPEAVNVFQEVRATDPALGVLTGHTGKVQGVAYSPDGSRILTASSDHTVRIWDARTGVQLRVISGHTEWVQTVQYSPDGTEIVTGSLDGTARTWDAHTGSLRRVLVHAGPVGCARYSPDGTRILTAGNAMVRIWDAASGTQLAEFSGGHRRSCAVYSPDGTRLVMPSDDKTARIWDARTGAQLAALSGHTDEVTGASYSPDGAQVVTASDDGTARTWNARTGAPLFVLGGRQYQVWFAGYSPDGATIATTSTDKIVRIWDAVKGTQIRIMTGHIDLVADAAFSPDGKRLVTGGWDSVARIWDLTGGLPAVILAGHTGDITGVAYSPNGMQLATASMDKTARLWDAHSGAQLAMLSGHTKRLNSVAYSPDGAYIVTASEEDVRVWDARTGAPVRTLSGAARVGLARFVMYASYSPDGARIVAFYGDLTFSIWDARTGVQLAISSGHHANFAGATGSGATATYSPDGRWILTGSIDKTARVWDAQTLAQRAVLPHSDFVNTAFYSPDGSRIVTSTDDSNANIWDVAGAIRIGVLSGHHSPVACAAFSLDGTRIVTSGDSTVRIWDAHAMVQLAVLTAQGGGTVAWSPDGMHVAGVSDDKTVRIWDARIPADLPRQILWAQAAEPDPLSDVQRTQLGFSQAVSLLGAKSESSAAASGAASKYSPCDLQAAAFYDPNRRAPGLDRTAINGDLASTSCLREASSEAAVGRTIYQAGRALFANGKIPAARQYFERALTKNYPATRIDLALLLSDPFVSMLDPERAVSLLEQAWEEGLAIAGFELGALYERGVAPAGGAGKTRLEDPEKAWFWYREAAKRDEPHALARLAEEEERKAVLGASSNANALLLKAFALYARAADRAHALDWPDEVSRSWRYRRSMLARVLAADGLMVEVADAYSRIFDARPP